LGQKLAQYAPGHRFTYRFTLVDGKEINAFALPGGPIYVHRGTILAATSEAQLAGVLAHEISHVALRHSTNQASKAMLAQAPLAILGGVLSGGGG
jgi:predicted Zn-dependent protease